MPSDLPVHGGFSRGKCLKADSGFRMDVEFKGPISKELSSIFILAINDPVTQAISFTGFAGKSITD